MTQLRIGARACHRLAVVATAAWCVAGLPVAAENFPDRPIRLIVPAGPGGPTDLPARLVSQMLHRLAQRALVENRAGAGGAIGARAVMTAAPDGYTLLVGNTSVLAVFPAVSASAGYDPAKNFAPVAKVSESYQILVVPSSSAFTSVRELVAHAKAHPGKLNIAHTGSGGLPHLTVELFKSLAGIDIVAVSFQSRGETGAGGLARAGGKTLQGDHLPPPLPPPRPPPAP